MNLPRTVYIVDDEAAVRKALRLMMTRAGYDVEVFASAAEFLDAYDETKTGCLVLDVRMPGMDGLTLLRHLTAHRMPLPVIMLSAHGDIPMAVGAVKTGAVDFLEKPAQASLLREKVAKALETAERWQEESDVREEVLEDYAKLSPREREVAELLADGKSVSMIATIFGTSKNTVRVQRHNIQNKLRTSNTAELARIMAIVRDSLAE